MIIMFGRKLGTRYGIQRRGLLSLWEMAEYRGQDCITNTPAKAAKLMCKLHRRHPMYEYRLVKIKRGKCYPIKFTVKLK